MKISRPVLITLFTTRPCNVAIRSSNTAGMVAGAFSSSIVPSKSVETRSRASDMAGIVHGNGSASKV
jgi:hypothetical protein